MSASIGSPFGVSIRKARGSEVVSVAVRMRTGAPTKAWIGDDTNPRVSSALTGQVPASSGEGGGAGGGGAGVRGGGGGISATALAEPAGASIGGSFDVAPAGGERWQAAPTKRHATTVAACPTRRPAK